MSGSMPPLPQYAFMAWCSVKKSTGTPLPLPIVWAAENYRAGIAQWYRSGSRAGWSRVRVPGGAGNFPLHHRVQTGSGAHQASYPMGTGDSFPGGKAVGGKGDHSPPSTAEVKECVELYLHSQYVFKAWCLVKHRDNFTFYHLTYKNTCHICMLLNSEILLIFFIAC
jgi:hypothetical protein